ncbi:MAG: isochorismatase family protein [Armatimonadota bacterium]|nr:isochorismatase family protein [Armatimonadota bacterium]
MLELTGRYYRSIPITDPGYEEEPLRLPVDETALVSLHCWNIGCPGGPELDPDFCVGMGYPGVTAEAYRIMREAIRPALDAARGCGLAVCHVQAEGIAKRYPEWYDYALDEPAESAIPKPEAPSEAIPGHRKAILERSHGVDYVNRSGLATMDFPEVVAPQPGEPIVHQTPQFDRVLRKRGIVNLIYAGFATDMCILNAPGGMGPMFGLGYRVILIRDATIGVEPPDFLPQRIATRWGIRYHETHWGDTVALDDLLDACGSVTSEP